MAAFQSAFSDHKCRTRQIICSATLDESRQKSRHTAKARLHQRRRMLPKQVRMVMCLALQLWMGMYCFYGCPGALKGMVVEAANDSVDQLFARFFERMEQNVLAMAKEVERLFLQAGHCDAAELESCANANYDHCASRYSSSDLQCTDNINFRDQVCGPTDSNCSVLCDFSNTAIRLPASAQKGPFLNPTDPAVIESICITRNLTQWLVNKYVTDTPSWQSDFGVQPRSYYFGSVTGSFRIFPARRYPTCGTYDPRVRPWYVAASSGPKNVLLILDTSGSMSGERFSLLKQAAKRIVSTLSVGDRVGIIPFNSDVTRVIADQGGQYFYTTNSTNKDILSTKIDSLQTSGATNFEAGFTAAFDLLDRSIDRGAHVACTTAILFFTDGTMTLPRDTLESDVIRMVQNRITQSSEKLGGKAPILLFTYSITDDPENAGPDRFPSRLACSVPTGVWSKIESQDKIVSSLSSYTSLLALGLGNAAGSNFVAWSEPYKFTSNNVMGTSVAVPVYDRRTEPNLFLGVVTIDVALDALEGLATAAGASSSVATDGNEAIKRVIAKATSVCPVLNLTTCTLESFRLNTVGKEKALCTNQCANGTKVSLKVQTCKDQNESVTYPTNLWVNSDDANKTYQESVCCLIGENTPSSQCPAPLPVSSGGREGSRPPLWIMIGSILFSSWIAASAMLLG